MNKNNDMKNMDDSYEDSNPSDDENDDCEDNE
jgi:hypothetical protein